MKFHIVAFKHKDIVKLVKVVWQCTKMYKKNSLKFRIIASLYFFGGDNLHRHNQE